MYIYKIMIKNFRAIKTLEWKPNKDTNVIIGANGCGKSTLAIALDYLLNPYLQWYNKTLSEMDYYDRDMKNQISIEAWFKDVEDFVVDDGELLLEHINKEDEVSEDGQDLILITRFIGDINGKISHVIISNGREYPFRQIYKGLANFKYIEADRDPLNELSFNSKSILSKVMQDDTLSALVQGIISDFNCSSTETLMKDTNFKNKLERLGNSYADFDLISNDNASISVEATELTERKTLNAYSLVYKNKDTSNYIPLKYQSRGIKNLMLLITLQEAMNESGILFLEEPEQNLEPYMQRKIIKKICSLNSGQVFFTTHSIEIAKVYDFKNIFLMKRGKISNLPNLLDIDKKFPKHVERFAKREILSGLFAKGILLVEGESELSGLPLFSQLYVNGIEDCGVELTEGGGKDNVFKYASYYSKCDVPVISLVDNDYDITNLLDKYSTNNIKSMVLCQPKDYETAIISLRAFKENWMELFEDKYPFNKYKDNYIKPFNHESSKSILLKQGYKEIESDIKKVKTIKELVDSLTADEIIEYQREFLHINLSGIIEARDVAIYLIDKSYENNIDEKIPCAFKNIFKLIGVYMNNNSICENSSICIVKKVMDTSYENQDVCQKCGGFKKDYENDYVIQVV